MTDLLNFLWNNGIALLAISIAILIPIVIQIWVIVINRRDALSAQRYEILIALFDLSYCWASMNIVLASTPTTPDKGMMLYDYKTKSSDIVNKILHLIYKPTTMPDSQIEKIVRAIIPRPEATQNNLTPINEAIGELKNQLKPSLTKILSDIRQQADSGTI